jgi:hypothetical protein
MRALTYSLFLLVVLIPSTMMSVQEAIILLQTKTASIVRIDTPGVGQAVQGTVVIHGSTGTEAFQSYEVNFTFTDDPTHTWFLIQEGSLPILDDVLAVWDTTVISDGEYTLRLLVTSTDGTQQEALINDLRIRNYTPIETNTTTPTPADNSFTSGSSATISTPGSIPTKGTLVPVTPTPLPTNPAVVTRSQMVGSFGKGAAFSVGALILLGAYLGIRSILHKNR